eukprot:scaffold511_cov111-Isochrysis_galbana.AAC.3
MPAPTCMRRPAALPAQPGDQPRAQWPWQVQHGHLHSAPRAELRAAARALFARRPTATAQ